VCPRGPIKRKARRGTTKNVGDKHKFHGKKSLLTRNLGGGRGITFFKQLQGQKERIVKTDHAQKSPSKEGRSPLREKQTTGSRVDVSKPQERSSKKKTKGVHNGGASSLEGLLKRKKSGKQDFRTGKREIGDCPLGKRRG